MTLCSSSASLFLLRCSNLCFCFLFAREEEACIKHGGAAGTRRALGAASRAEDGGRLLFSEVDLILFIYLFDGCNLGERRGGGGEFGSKTFRSSQTSQRQTDRYMMVLPSGDSSWTYVPVRYLCTSADLPLARLPTMPCRRREQSVSDQ